MLRTAVVDGKPGKVYGRRVVKGESQVFVLFDENAKSLDESGEWHPESVVTSEPVG